MGDAFLFDLSFACVFEKVFLNQNYTITGCDNFCFLWLIFFEIDIRPPLIDNLFSLTRTHLIKLYQ